MNRAAFAALRLSEAAPEWRSRLDAVGGSAWTEPLALWEQLSKAGFIQGNYVGGSTAPTAADTDLAPRNAFNGFLVLYRTNNYLDAASTTPAER